MSICRTELIQHLQTVALFNLSLTLTSINYKTFAYMVPSSSLEKRYGKVCVCSCVSPVSVADRAKGARVKFDLTLT